MLVFCNVRSKSVFKKTRYGGFSDSRKPKKTRELKLCPNFYQNKAEKDPKNNKTKKHPQKNLKKLWLRHVPLFFFVFSSFFFPTCQVRVVRFYVSLPCFSSFRRLLVLRLPRSSSTAILRDQCSAPDLNRDPVRSVFRAGPQPRSGEISVPCRTSTAIL